MPTTGDLIRLLNYVDDITSTLRRINASVPIMTEDERKKLAEYIRKAEPTCAAVLERLEKGKLD